MSVTTIIRGIPVQFPFKPYDIQIDYMDKVIECLETESTAVLESPTGTGKTLSLLCSSLAWLQQKKLQIQAQRMQTADKLSMFNKQLSNGDIEMHVQKMTTGRELLGLPTIIYASRTHSQLSQAVQELKRSAYNNMCCTVLGSRDQLCIHPEVIAESDRNLRLHMCRLKLASHACHYNNRVESKKDIPEISQATCMDIEDMVSMGKKHIFCPYYMTKERRGEADIIFTPYNYLLDPLSRKSLGLKLANSIVILDEGHNVEKVCEESASVQLKSSDLALAIDETANIMKMLSETPGLIEHPDKSIDPDMLANFKGMLHELEKVIDEVPLKQGKDQVTNFPGDYIFELFEKAQFTPSNHYPIVALIDQVLQFLAAQNEGPFARKGKGLSTISDFLTVAFGSSAPKEKIRQCYKVHIEEEVVKRQGPQRITKWVEKNSKSEKKQRILSFWCFNPGFGMRLVMSEGIKSLILTSGTLAPLKPLISELGLNVTLSLENPHIVNESQICVKILRTGPDGVSLNSNYKNRDNPNYVYSLGRTIANLTRIIPHGLLIFFPSYPVMLKCKNAWEEKGVWADISSQKTIFVEPKEKDAFNAAMTGYYDKVNDPKFKGAIFMAVCRGKVSEGLDFANNFGRAVIITGLPYPPLMDPRVILKKLYLDICHSQDKEYLDGQSWYSLEASRAVNQAIGRVIRHKDDYGAILLLDERFNSSNVKQQMSRWLRDHIRVVNNFGEVVRDLSRFFRAAQAQFPTPDTKITEPSQATFDTIKTYSAPAGSGSSNFSTPGSSTGNCDDVLLNQYMGIQPVMSIDNPNGSVTLHRRREDENTVENCPKRRKFRDLLAERSHLSTSTPEEVKLDKDMTHKDYVIMLRNKLGQVRFKEFQDALQALKKSQDIKQFISVVDQIVPKDLKYVLVGIDRFVTGQQQIIYRDFLRRSNLPIPEDL